MTWNIQTSPNMVSNKILKYIFWLAIWSISILLLIRSINNKWVQSRRNGLVSKAFVTCTCNICNTLRQRTEIYAVGKYLKCVVRWYIIVNPSIRWWKRKLNNLTSFCNPLLPSMKSLKYEHMTNVLNKSTKKCYRNVQIATCYLFRVSRILTHGGLLHRQ